MRKNGIEPSLFEHEEYVKLGQLIREARKKKQMLMKTVAEELHMSVTSYTRVEKGLVSRISPGLIVRISNLLELSLEEMYGVLVPAEDPR